MPRLALVKISDDTWEYPVDALVSKLRRHLHTLIPYRELYYSKSTCGYYAKVRDLGQNGGAENITHGPYYYAHLVGLARMTNAFGAADRLMPKIEVYNRFGKRFPEQPLPKALQFTVVTMALAEMCATLRGRGYTVQEPGSLPDTAGPTGMIVPPPLGLPVTSPVTPEDPLELDWDEAERIMTGGGG